jgi:membrane-bound lytic murein transglycosylase B
MKAIMRTFWCVVGLLLITVNSSWAEPHPGADQFIEAVVSEHALDPELVRSVVSQAEYQQSIIDAMTRPAEAKPWHEYRGKTRIAGGAEFWRANEALLTQISETYGIPIELVVAIVGVETNYGMNTGSFRVIDALATLGFYYEPRADFFARELGHFMALAEEESLPLTDIRGSYAGAMGLGQFIPSSYRAYAVDFDGSGHRDLWRSLPDALGSVANYLAEHRWIPGQPIALPTEAVPEDLDLDQFELKPNANGPEHWVGLNNFYVITRYNRSPLYAMAVTQLADEIAQRAE